MAHGPELTAPAMRQARRVRELEGELAAAARRLSAAEAKSQSLERDLLPYRLESELKAKLDERRGRSPGTSPKGQRDSPRRSPGKLLAKVNRKAREAREAEALAAKLEELGREVETLTALLEEERMAREGVEGLNEQLEADKSQLLEDLGLLEAELAAVKSNSLSTVTTMHEAQLAADRKYQDMAYSVGPLEGKLREAEAEGRGLAVELKACQELKASLEEQNKLLQSQVDLEHDKRVSVQEELEAKHGEMVLKGREMDEAFQRRARESEAAAREVANILDEAQDSLTQVRISHLGGASSLNSGFNMLQNDFRTFRMGMLADVEALRQERRALARDVGSIRGIVQTVNDFNQRERRQSDSRTAKMRVEKFGILKVMEGLEQEKQKLSDEATGTLIENERLYRGLSNERIQRQEAFEFLRQEQAKNKALMQQLTEATSVDEGEAPSHYATPEVSFIHDFEVQRSLQLQSNQLADAEIAMSAQRDTEAILLEVERAAAAALREERANGSDSPIAEQLVLNQHQQAEELERLRDVKAQVEAIQGKIGNMRKVRGAGW